MPNLKMEFEISIENQERKSRVERDADVGVVRVDLGELQRGRFFP